MIFVGWGAQQSCPTEQGFEGLANFAKGGLQDRRAGDEDHITALGDEGQKALHGGAQQPFGTIALHGFAQLSPGGNANPDTRFGMRIEEQNKKRVGIGFSLLPHPSEIGGACEAEASLHLKTSVGA